MMTHTTDNYITTKCTTSPGVIGWYRFVAISTFFVSHNAVLQKCEVSGTFYHTSANEILAEGTLQRKSESATGFQPVFLFLVRTKECGKCEESQKETIHYFFTKAIANWR